MYKLLHLSFTCLLILLAIQKTSAQCPAGQNELKIVVNTDYYYTELSWQISGEADGQIYGGGSVPDSSTHTYTYCVPDGQCMKVTFTDDAADGIFPDGWYKIYINDALVYEKYGPFFWQDVVLVNCPPGFSCNSAITLEPGTHTTPSANETWYTFTPVDTGLYLIETCGADCPTKIWAYDRCFGIYISDGPAGALSYSETGCPDSSAVLSLHLAGGHEYFIRVAYAQGNCSDQPIDFSLTYLGPITGCMDPTACNYDPLAAIPGDTCIYPGSPDCPVAPDLAIVKESFLSSLTFSAYFNPDICGVEEGCLRGLGNRMLIEFTTHIKNIGDADYYIGHVPASENEPSTQFVYDPCHGHWHYLGYADYLLYDATGARIPIGSKTGFCVLDLECSPGNEAQYDCINMGISAGCGDVYSIGLPCQWIDITNIPAGDYTMVIRVNWDKSPDKLGRVEKRFDNNWAQACFTLTYDNGNPEVVFHPDADCPVYTDCAGEQYGAAQPDCNGQCNGVAIHGDWNLDTLNTTVDIDSYLSAMLSETGEATACFDLHDDGEINMFDAALLQECVVHADDQSYWIDRIPCDFPTGFHNDLDKGAILPGSVDTVAHTFDVLIQNPFNEIIGYEFKVSGLVIDSVENLATTHHVTPQFNATTGKILALAADESVINKHIVPGNFLRIHYSSLTSSNVCVAEIISVVNDKYQESDFKIPEDSCIHIQFVNAFEPQHQAFRVYVQPNPMQESTHIFFENPDDEAFRFVLRDVSGRVLREFNNIRGESLQVSRQGLPEGPYWFSLSNSKGIVGGKLVITN